MTTDFPQRLHLSSARAATLLLALTLFFTGCTLRSTARTSHAVSSNVWKRGATWQVVVWQNSGSVAPHSKGTWFKSVYHFTMGPAAHSENDSWQVKAALENAEGLSAKGFTLTYRKTPDRDLFQLRGVAFTGGKMQSVEFAPFVLGRDFPLQKTLTRLPKPSEVIRKAQGSSGLPPALPGE